MNKRSVFLQWALFACLVAMGVYVAWQSGWVEYLQKDPTHITYLSLSAGALATLWCGRLCWKLSSGHDPDEIGIGLDIAHYASSFCVSIGLIGTAVGYLLMFKQGSVNAPASEVVRQTYAAASVAIVNTVCGAVCGLLVEVQSQAIKYAVAKANKLAGKAAS